MLSLWRRLPVIVRAPVAGLAVSAAGIYPWVALSTWNQRVFLRVPWALLPMAVYLRLYWRYLNGAGWPRTTADLRRASLRANPLTAEMWGMSLLAGALGLAALLALLGIMGRVVTLPAEEPTNVPPQMPFVTTFLLLVMGSIVAGATEEAGFRGYMQGPIERQHGPAAAILVNGVLFGLAHYTHHPASVFAMLPYYVAVAAVYGGLAYATNSILPGVVLHAGGDVFSLMRLWTTGRPEWQVTAAPPRLIWESGVNAGFLGSVIAFVLLGAAAVWAYSSLARAARAERIGSTGKPGGAA